MKNEQIGKSKLNIKKIAIIGLVITALCIGIMFIIRRDASSIPTTSEIDLSFSNWEVIGAGTGRSISEVDDYIIIYDNYVGKDVQATLDVGSIIRGTLKFQVQTPNPDWDNAFHFELLSGEDVIITITRYKSSGKWYFQHSNGAYILIQEKDLNWHSIEISFEINGDNSVVSINVDGNVKIDSLVFNTVKLNINSIRIRSGKYFAPNLTYLKLEELIKFN